MTTNRTAVQSTNQATAPSTNQVTQEVVWTQEMVNNEVQLTLTNVKQLLVSGDWIYPGKRFALLTSVEEALWAIDQLDKTRLFDIRSWLMPSGRVGWELYNTQTGVVVERDEKFVPLRTIRNQLNRDARAAAQTASPTNTPST
jgi:hypothetical protein